MTSNGWRAGCHGWKTDDHHRTAPSLFTGKWLDSDGSLAGITRKIRGGVPEPKPKNKSVPVPAHGGASLSDSDVAAVAELWPQNADY